jgi:hypothetical protein
MAFYGRGAAIEGRPAFQGRLHGLPFADASRSDGGYWAERLEFKRRYATHRPRIANSRGINPTATIETSLREESVSDESYGYGNPLSHIFQPPQKIA